MILRKLLVYSLCLSLVGCNVTSGVNNFTSLGIGPRTSTETELEETRLAEAKSNVRLDVSIPVFDAGLGATEEEQKIWPELRRAEAIAFAWMLKEKMEESNSFGAIRVTPDQRATSELYVLGKILESTGEEVKISIQVIDISGKDLIAESRSGGLGFISTLAGEALSVKTFSHTVKKDYLESPRNRKKNGYEPLFAEIADYVKELVSDLSSRRASSLQSIAQMRFATSLSSELFSENLANTEGQYRLVRKPSQDDPTFKRVKTIRVRDQMFVDKLQVQYELFHNKVSKTHRAWQEQVLKESEARSEARAAAAGKAVGAIALIGLAVLAAAAGSSSAQNYDAVGASLATSGAVLAGVAGAVMVQKSFQALDEAEVHTKLIEELGTSTDVELAPQVILFEKEQKELTGSASEQFSQWRAFLKKIYELGKTPKVQL
jgi:hypothetical protein